MAVETFSPVDGSATYKGQIGVIARDQGPLFNVETDGAVPDWNGSTGTDSSTAFDTALGKAELVSGTVYFKGEFYLGTGIEIPHNVSFIGDSIAGTVLYSDYDGHIVRTADASAQNTGQSIGNFSIVGDVTKTSQDGISFLRAIAPFHAFSIDVSLCGRDGVCIYRGIGSHYTDISSHENVGRGYRLDEGYSSWANFPATPDGFPTNACVFTALEADKNDAAGLYLANSSGNSFFGGFFQNSYLAFGDNVGYNILLSTDAFGNHFYSSWVEGACKAHVYCSTGSTAQDNVNTFVNLMHRGGGSATDRAVIVDKGAVFINGHAASGAYAETTREGVAMQAAFRCCTDDTDAWASATAYIIGDLVTNDGGNRYICTVAGTSAGSGGPTGEVINPASRDITDNGVTWIWDGIDAIGRLGVFGVRFAAAANNVNFTNYRVIENQLSVEPTAAYASEIMLFDTGHPQP